MAGRAMVWNVLGTLPWIWALPLGWRQRHEVREYERRLTFLAVWFLPAFLFNLFVHTGNPGHVLTTIPVLCLVGACCLAAAEQWLGRRWNLPLKEQSFVVWIALLGNLLLFFGDFPLPQREPVRHFRGLVSAVDAFRFGRYRSSYDRVRWVGQMTRLGLQQIQHLKSTTDRPVLVLWSRDGEPVWRKISYYVPTEKLWVMDEAGDPAVLASKARLWLRNQVVMESAGSPPIRVPIPRNARLIWIVSPGAVESLARAISLQEAPPLYYTDLPSDASSFRWGSFEFIPQ